MSKTTFGHMYRFIAVGGLERCQTNPMYYNALNGGTNWVRVNAEDFLSMTWEELEHVAHVIRDSNARPTKETAPRLGVKNWPT